MITKSQKTKLSMIRKISVIPVLIIMLFVFSVSSEKSVASLSSNVMIEDVTQDVNTERSITTNNSDVIIEDVTQDVNTEKYEIQDIKVTGAAIFEESTLISYSSLKVGEVISIPGDEITNATDRFWQQGLFSDVKILAIRVVDDKVWLEIQLKLRPRIAEINYNGVKKNERKDLETNINLRKGYMITPHIVDRVKNNVKKYFDDKGYKNVNIDVIEKPDPTKEGEVIVNINIDKNEKT